MDKYSASRANSELKSILDEYSYEYQKAAKSSRQELLDSLAPGARIPKDDGLIYGQHNQDAFLEHVGQPCRQRVQTAIEDLQKILTAEAQAAPSTEAVNTITLLRTRRNVTEKEITDLMKKYGGNIQSARAIADIAAGHGIYVEAEDIEQTSRELANLGRSIDKALLTPKSKPDAYFSLVKMEIDDILEA